MSEAADYQRQEKPRFGPTAGGSVLVLTDLASPKNKRKNRI